MARAALHSLREQAAALKPVRTSHTGKLVRDSGTPTHVRLRIRNISARSRGLHVASDQGICKTAALA